MKKTFYAKSNKERKEKISNRMLISVGYALLAMFLLYIMMRVARGNFGTEALLSYTKIMLVAFIVSALLAVTCYVLSLMDRIKPDSKLAKPELKQRFRNYGHLFLAAALISFYVNFAYYTHWLPIETAPTVLAFLKNIVKAYYVVFSVLGVYIVFTVAYHLYLYYIKKW